jgi:hypothetical protein
MNKLSAFLCTLIALLSPRKLKENCKAVINLSVVLMIGIAFASLNPRVKNLKFLCLGVKIVIAFIIYTIADQLMGPTTSSTVNNTIGNITAGFDNAIAKDRGNNRLGFITCILDKIVVSCYHNFHFGSLYKCSSPVAWRR